MLMMKKLNNCNLLNKKYVMLLINCILFFFLQLKPSFSQTNDPNKEVNSNKVNAEIIKKDRLRNNLTYPSG